MSAGSLRWWAVLAAVSFSVVGCLSADRSDRERAADDPADFTVLAYNVRHGRGTDGELDLERIARVVLGSRASLVALQEVDERAERTGGVDQAAELGRLTGMHHAFAPFMDFQGGRYGLAVLSAHPILSERVIELPAGEREPRSALLVEVMPPGAVRLVFVCVHFDWLADDTSRLAQARALLEALEEEPAVILAGDFNDVPGSRTVRAFEEAGFVAAEPASGRGFTYPAGSPGTRIDFVMIRPAFAAEVESEVLDEPVASDHRPVLGRFWWTR